MPTKLAMQPLAQRVGVGGPRPGLPAHRSLPVHRAQPRRLPRLPGAVAVLSPRAAPPLSAAVPPPTAGFEATNAKDVEVEYLTQRAQVVTSHFKNALGVDDFLARLECGLWQYGFQNDNSIAMVNLCRDEVTQTLHQKIEQVFGASFVTNGLGGLLSCGVTGMAAGLSHSPVSQAGRERYIFFSFPHIAIDSKGVVGHISRPGRPAVSCACGALLKALGETKRDGMLCSCKPPGVHDAADVEFSVLKQRLARRLEFEGYTDAKLGSLDLVEYTQVAARSTTKDLELLIDNTVDPVFADYAVITGVQIHNWGVDFEDEEPNLEFVAPTAVYVVIGGQRRYLDLGKLPPLSRRQTRVLAAARTASPASEAHDSLSGSRLQKLQLPLRGMQPAERNAQAAPSRAAAGIPEASSATPRLLLEPTPAAERELVPVGAAAVSGGTMQVPAPAAGAVLEFAPAEAEAAPAPTTGAVLEFAPALDNAAAAAPGQEHEQEQQQQQQEAEEEGRVRVEFSVLCGVGFGDRVAVVGGAPELGAWDPAGALVLEWGEGDVWTGAAKVAAGAGAVPFKVIKLLACGGADWEQGDDRLLDLQELAPSEPSNNGTSSSSGSRLEAVRVGCCFGEPWGTSLEAVLAPVPAAEPEAEEVAPVPLLAVELEAEEVVPAPLLAAELEAEKAAPAPLLAAELEAEAVLAPAAAAAKAAPAPEPPVLLQQQLVREQELVEELQQQLEGLEAPVLQQQQQQQHENHQQQLLQQHQAHQGLQQQVAREQQVASAAAVSAPLRPAEPLSLEGAEAIAAMTGVAAAALGAALALAPEEGAAAAGEAAVAEEEEEVVAEAEAGPVFPGVSKVDVAADGTLSFAFTDSA